MSKLPVNQILCGDWVEVMKTFPSESIDLVMFSPPYWGLRDYQVEGQIGLEPTLEEYLDKLVRGCREIKRILKKTGSMYIVIGDSYTSTTTGSLGKNGWSRPHSRNQSIEARKHRNFGKIPQKCLLGIPWRLALRLIDDGWILRNDIIWYKPNHMPESVKDRLTNTYEHIFHFVKSRKYYYNLDFD